MDSQNIRLILRFNGKKYIFYLRSIIVFLIGGPLISFLIYLFLSVRFNFWIQEILTKQAVFLLNNIFNINSVALFNPNEIDPWQIFIPQNNNYLTIGAMCAAVHIFSIFIGLIIFIPHSQDSVVKEDIIWRKSKTLIVLIGIIYIMNLLRITLIILLNYNGLSLEFIHNFSNYLSGSIAALIFFIFIYKWIPEFFISIYYLYPLFTNNQ